MTAVRTQIRDTATTQEVLRCQNRGANPVEVSTDPAFTFGQGLLIAAGAEDSVTLQSGQRAFAVCGAGLSTQLVVD